MINILNKEIINLIKAGEVIESINSIVKELIENSIDASSKNIKIEIEKDTFFNIYIKDDGIGIKKEDIKLSILSHTTSKIKNIDDLDNINTYGFRGEALSSILSISDLEVSSKPKQQENGYFEKYIDQKLSSSGINSMNNGTIIKVFNIFKNTPVRLKYLKSDNLEKAKIYEVCKAMAISRPDISFELIMDKKQYLYTTGKNDDLETIGEIFGVKYLEDITYIEEKTNSHLYKIFIFSKEFLKNNKNDILIFLNNRFIKNYLLKEAIYSGCKQFLMQGKYPMAILKINQNIKLSDVNVHPQKLEVKILNEFALKAKIEMLIKDKLNSKIITSHDYFLNNDNDLLIDEKKENIINNTYNFQFNDNNLNNVNLEKNDLFFTETEKEYTLFLNNYNYKYETRLFNTYLLFSSFENLILIDQHAASERIRYEKLLNNYNSSYQISLLVPHKLVLEEDKKLRVKEKLEFLKNNNFIFNEDLDLIQYPSYILKKEIENCILFLIDQQKDINDYIDTYLKQIACKGAIKQGDILSKQEAENLIYELFKCKNPYKCIHNRPSIYKFSKYDLDKLFKRIV